MASRRRDRIEAHRAHPESAVAYEALSVRQPWAHAIAALGKRVENRNWYRGQAAHQVGELIAVHASLKSEPDDVASLRHHGYDVPDGLPLGRVVAVARVIDVLGAEDALKQYPEQQPWITGPLCLVFGQVIALEHPVVVGGALGFWLMPERVRIDVSAQVYQHVDRDWQRWRSARV